MKASTIYAFFVTTWISISLPRAMSYVYKAKPPFPLVSQRTNFCPAMQMVLNGTLDMTNFLRGKTITVGYANNSLATSPQFFTFNATTGLPNNGFFYNLWMQIAAQGGFSINWVMMPPSKASQSLAVYASKYAPYVDFFPYRSISDVAARREIGIGYTSVVLPFLFYLWVRDESTTVPNIWSFTIPFSPQLWGLTFATLFFTGILLSVLRYISRRTGKVGSKLNSNIVMDMFEGLNAFASKKPEESTQDLPLMIIALGVNFLLFIVVATYLANLAFALTAKTVVPIGLTSMDDANTKGMLSLCHPVVLMVTVSMLFIKTSLCFIHT